MTAYPTTSAGAPRLSTQALNRAATRQRLLDAGERLFAQHGFHAVNSNQIAREAGTATGTFYLHFENKEALFGEIASTLHDQIRARIQARRALADDSIAEANRARAEALVEFCEEHGQMVRVVFGPDGQATQIAQRVRAAIVADMQAEQELRIARGELTVESCGPLAAEMRAAAWIAAAHWWVEHQDPNLREQVIETLVAQSASG